MQKYRFPTFNCDRWRVAFAGWVRAPLAALTTVAAFALASAGLSRDLATEPDLPLAYGPDRLEAEIGGHVLRVYTYRPTHCATPAILIVFHGNGRGAKSYRDSASVLADRVCLIVFAPLFAKARFPNEAYHRGGIVDDGRILPRSSWTVTMAEPLVEWARRFEGHSDRVFLFGHSAGGQFLSRVAAYAMPENVERIVFANPSTYVLPDLAEPAPYGFGGLGARADEMLQSYLELPLTIYLGDQDVGTKNLTGNTAAVRQGENRHDRGWRTLLLAQTAAREQKVPLGWRLVEAEGIGHTARGMLRAEEMEEALGLSLP